MLLLLLKIEVISVVLNLVKKAGYDEKVSEMKKNYTSD